MREGPPEVRRPATPEVDRLPLHGRWPSNLRRWLTPGIGVKRWLLLTFAGLLLLALGVAHLIRQATQDLQPGGLTQLILDAVTLRFLPYPLRGLIVSVAGLALVGFGAYRTIRALTAPFTPAQGGRLVELIYQRKSLARGPRIVAIGGGTGLSTLLRGLKEHTSNLTAVVAVADDGGSSGVLREELGIPPVGDIRRCLAALADSELLMGELLEHRFAGSPSDSAPEAGGPLGGHPVGNLLLAAMTQLENGDFEEGVRRANRILAVRGQVLPAAATPLTMHARMHDGTILDGQSLITRTAGIERAWVTPSDAPACDDALQAIAEADLIVLGPGSLYTSLLPTLLLTQIRDAVAAAPALRMYVCNVATQTGETASLDLAGHVEALVAHAGAGIVDCVLANNRLITPVQPVPPAEPVRLTWPPNLTSAPRLILDDVVDPNRPHHHDPARLAAAVIQIWEREGGARRRVTAVRSA
ncbi:MAG TPA: gluconeogenesis factor YvcK family protein [Verrucomicrobiae bacterium]|nr:gluconeogenesis factor YvcK family protein [Verrucomicrobiae bacterium]